MAGSFLLLLLFVTLTRLHAAEPMRILAFGDSLSAGYQLPAGKGFTDQLQKSLTEQGLNVEVINAAVSGDTSANGLSRLDWSTPDGIDLVVLELGANDALQGLPVDKTKANLAAMIEKFRAKGAKVALMGMKAPPNMGQTYVSAFDAIYPALAEEMNVPLLPFFLEGVAGDPSLNLADGIHPNPQGIEIIVSNVAPFLLDIVKDLN
ncbi:arylesterase [Cohaesibacter sp. CAU 1516]|nr:arylesterase [Cohaesibacter sp. CAU 1516]